MTRPFYETAADLEREKAVIQQVTRAWKCAAIKQPPARKGQAHIDFKLTWGRKERFAEVKTRQCKIDKHERYLIAEKKVREARRHRNSILIVQFLDGLRWCYFNEPYERKEGGRYDRGDPHDIEMCAMFPMSAFKTLEDFP